MTVRTLAFWDDVVVWYSLPRRLRAQGLWQRTRHRRARPSGEPARQERTQVVPQPRSPFPCTWPTQFICERWSARPATLPAQAIIMDRYIYDELANLPLSNPLTRMVRPDDRMAGSSSRRRLSARRRSGSSARPQTGVPVEFMRECRRSYFRLAELLGSMTIIPPLAALCRCEAEVVSGNRASGNAPAVLRTGTSPRERVNRQS